MSKAFVDTTLLTNALLKSGKISKDAKDLIKSYAVSELPVYAIKEFKAGPLYYFSWMHNKLADLKSFSGALSALQRMSLTPRRYLPATAIEALAVSADNMRKTMTIGNLAQKYGLEASVDVVLCDQFRLAIKTKIFTAWKRKDALCTRVVGALDCYPLSAPIEQRGLINIQPDKCQPYPECCLAKNLKARPDDLEKLHKVCIDHVPVSREHQKRASALKELRRKPKTAMSQEMCRNLGDAYFAFFAPIDSTIITTNLKDHEELATALGKSVLGP